MQTCPELCPKGESLDDACLVYIQPVVPVVTVAIHCTGPESSGWQHQKGE